MDSMSPTLPPASAVVSDPPHIVAVGFRRINKLLQELAPDFAARASVEVLDMGFEQAVSRIRAIQAERPIDVVVSAGSNGAYLRQHLETPVVLVKGDLRAIARARILSQRTMLNIRQNLFFAFVYNVVGVPLAALGWLSPEVAGLAMAMSSVSVVSNALMLARWSPRLAALDASAAGEKTARS